MDVLKRYSQRSFLLFQMVEIWAVLDGEPEGNETFAVTLSTPTGGARLGEHLQTFITVLENLAPAGLFRITPSVNRSEQYSRERVQTSVVVVGMNAI